MTIKFNNTSSVTSMLDHLDWETLESRRTKFRLVMFFTIHDLIDIPTDRNLKPASTPNRYPIRQFTTSSDYHKYSFPQIQYVSRIPSKPQSLSFPVWYPSNWSSLKFHFKLGRAGKIQVKPKVFLCCAGWEFVCPGTFKVARLDRNEEMKIFVQTFFIFNTSIIPS